MSGMAYGSGYPAPAANGPAGYQFFLNIFNAIFARYNGHILAATDGGALDPHPELLTATSSATVATLAKRGATSGLLAANGFGVTMLGTGAGDIGANPGIYVTRNGSNANDEFQAIVSGTAQFRYGPNARGASTPGLYVGEGAQFNAGVTVTGGGGIATTGSSNGISIAGNASFALALGVGGLINAAGGVTLSGGDLTMSGAGAITIGSGGVKGITSGAILVGQGATAAAVLSGTVGGQVLTWNGSNWTYGLIGNASIPIAALGYSRITDGHVAATGTPGTSVTIAGMNCFDSSGNFTQTSLQTVSLTTPIAATTGSNNCWVLIYMNPNGTNGFLAGTPAVSPTKPVLTGVQALAYVYLRPGTTAIWDTDQSAANTGYVVDVRTPYSFGIGGGGGGGSIGTAAVMTMGVAAGAGAAAGTNILDFAATRLASGTYGNAVDETSASFGRNQGLGALRTGDLHASVLDISAGISGNILGNLSPQGTGTASYIQLLTNSTTGPAYISTNTLNAVSGGVQTSTRLAANMTTVISNAISTLTHTGAGVYYLYADLGTPGTAGTGTSGAGIGGFTIVLAGDGTVSGFPTLNNTMQRFLCKVYFDGTSLALTNATGRASFDGLQSPLSSMEMRQDGFKFTSAGGTIGVGVTGGVYNAFSTLTSGVPTFLVTTQFAEAMNMDVTFTADITQGASTHPVRVGLFVNSNSAFVDNAFESPRIASTTYSVSKTWRRVSLPPGYLNAGVQTSSFVIPYFYTDTTNTGVGIANIEFAGSWTRA